MDYINPCRIVVAEDDASVQSVFSQALSRAGFSVETASDGKEALEKVLSSNTSLLITDKNMPLLNGEELFYTLKEKKPNLPVVMVTGTGYDESAEQMMHSGLSSYVEKPVPINEFVSLAFRAINVSEKENEKNSSKIVFYSPKEDSFKKYVSGISGKHFIVPAYSESDIYRKLRNFDFGALVFGKDVGEEEQERISESVGRNRVFLAIAGEEQAGSDDALESIIAKNEKIMNEYMKGAPPQVLAATGAMASGKTTIMHGLGSCFRKTGCLIKRYNTRSPRPFELNGEDHYYVAQDYITSHPDLMVFRQRNSYDVGIDLNDISYALARGQDIILTLASPDIFKRMYCILREKEGVKGSLIPLLIESNPRCSEERTRRRGGAVQATEKAIADSALFRKHFQDAVGNEKNAVYAFNEQTENKNDCSSELSFLKQMENIQGMIFREIRLRRAYSQY
jgi:CheY-like chemotaxis protein